MPATPEQIAAYEAALYVVFGKPELVLRIGEHNEDLDELLEVEGVTTAAYITAANPHGEPASAWKNEVANAALVELLSKAGHPCFEGEGRDPEKRWKPENAIVFAEKGKAPELVILGDGGDHGP
jgi:hypothetical protein